MNLMLMEECRMHFDNALEMYVSEIDGIIFACEDEPTNDYEESLQYVAKKYWSNKKSLLIKHTTK